MNTLVFGAQLVNLLCNAVVCVCPSIYYYEDTESDRCYGTERVWPVRRGSSMACTALTRLSVNK